MRQIYTTGIYIYALCVRVASLWHTKARQMCQGWKAVKSLLQDNSIDKIAPGKEKIAWFHASSLGEFEQARPVFEQYKKLHPEYKMCVTFFSPSGYEVRKNYGEADLICYLPMDTPQNARRFVAWLKPDIAFFVKYDFWFNYLNELHSRHVPTYLFSSIFRPGQYFFQWYGHWFCQQLHCYTHIFVQNQESISLLHHRGIADCSIAGDTRFDRVHDIALSAKQFDEIERFIGDKPVLMAGSSWEPDETNIKYFLDHYSADLKVVLAPHVISDTHLHNIEQLFGPSHCVRYSQLSATPAAHCQILVIDNIGMLSSLYRYATVAYIGGGFGRGIHNILEALTFGKPVCFGPNHQKFQEAKDILAQGGGFSYTTPQALTEKLTLWFDNNEAYTQASNICKDYVDRNLGATQHILDVVLNKKTQEK